MNYLSENPEQLPDVLFLDINMPRKNGPECLSEMKQNEKLRDLPVILFSTSNSRDKISTLFNTGAHIYIKDRCLIVPQNISQPTRENFVLTVHNSLPA
jgi:CheY-like chemotaxis protein